METYCMLPVLDTNKCNSCKLCVKNCVAKAINESTIEINEKKCILCGHCTAICPSDAVTIDGIFGDTIESLPEGFSSQLESLIINRRSIRNYTDGEIPRELVEKIVNTVNCSPTGTNSRKVGITVIDSREKIKALSDIIMKHFDIVTKVLLNFVTYPFLVLFLGKSMTEKLFSYKKAIYKYWEGNDILTHKAPLLFIFHSNKGATSPDQDTVIWATTALYFAETLGLGTCFNGFLVVGINTCKKARKFLNIPKNHKIYETFTAGYPLYKYKKGIIRDDLMVNYV